MVAGSGAATNGTKVLAVLNWLQGETEMARNMGNAIGKKPPAWKA